MKPLVSAIMPTRLRPEMAAHAVEMFRGQTYEPRELVIVDDDTGLSFADGAWMFPKREGQNVQYLTRPNLTVGEKRNIAIKAARGSIICHWDSDDLYSPDRIEDQVETLLASGSEIAAYYAMEFRDVQRGQRYYYDMGGPGHAIGTSLCYWRKTWEACPFREIEEGEDHIFVLGRKVTSCDAAGRIIARIHDGNTSDKRTAVQRNRVQWKELHEDSLQ